MVLSTLIVANQDCWPSSLVILVKQNLLAIFFNNPCDPECAGDFLNGDPLQGDP
jgi:hypothetical protein